MKFSIIINKWANFYFFVQNLSEWHFSNRKEYNNLWREELGPFSPEEEDVLKKFKKIRGKYKPAKTHFESAFFVAEDPWAYLEKTLNAKEYENIKEIFNLLKNKFNTLYAKDLPLLIKWQEALNNKINDPALIKSISETLSALYNTPVPEKTINVYLLFSAADRTGGGANINEQSVSVEISRYSLDGLNHAVGVIWHETIHLLFQNNFFFPLLLKHFSQERQIADLVNEATASALFPKGILGIRLLNNKPPAILYSGVDQKQTIDILNLMKEYLNSKKYFDDNYLKKISTIFKKTT